MKPTRKFEEKILDYEVALMSFAFHLTTDKTKAEDLFQDTMLKALKYSDKFVEPKNLKAWLFTIMRNNFINQYRRSKKFVSSSVPVDEYYDLESRDKSNPIDRLQFDYLNGLIGNLKKEFSYPFEQFVQGFKYKEIAHEMNLPIGTVKSRIHEARKQLMQQLQ